MERRNAVRQSAADLINPDVGLRKPISQFSFYLDPVLEPGRFDIHVGQSADPEEFLTGVIDVAPLAIP